MAEQEWKATPNGWTVAGELQGWRSRVEPVAEGVRVTAAMTGPRTGAEHATNESAGVTETMARRLLRDWPGVRPARGAEAAWARPHPGAGRG
jgi:hypothetical protein